MSALNSTKKARTAPPELRRKQLIDAAITCIGRLGISGTTLTAVTKEAGLSLGLVNFHFNSKNTLLTETLNSLAEEHRAIWVKALDQQDLSAADKLKAIVNAQFHPRVCSRKKLAVWFAFFGEATHRKAYRTSSSHFDFERQNVSADLCREIIEEGNYTDISAAAISENLEALFDGFWLNMLMYPDRFDRKNAARGVFGYLASVFPSHFSQHGMPTTSRG